MTAARCAPMTAALDLLVLDALLAPFGGLVRVLGGEVLASGRASPDSSRSNSGWWSGHSRPGPLDLLEAGLVGGRPREGQLVAVRTRRRPSPPSAGPRGSVNP